jgi:hypothetical protein
MKQEFEMQQQEMDDIIAINKDMPPVMKFGDSWSGLDLAERINAYWERLGDKYGFKSLTVEGSSRGQLFFLAEPKPIIVPKTQVEIEIDKYLDGTDGYISYAVKESCRKIVNQLQSCDYENEAGTLNTNIAFLALKQLAS